MDQRLSLVTLGVGDLEVSKRFYVDGLGWTPTLEVPGEVVFLQVAHGVLLALFSAADLAEDLGRAPPGGAGQAVWRVTLADNLGSQAEVDRAVERAVAAGATVVKPPQRAAWGGYHAYVADPDGFLWELAHNPGLQVGPDGRVSFGGGDEPTATSGG